MSKNLQHLKARTKAFNFSKSKNKNLQLLRPKIKAFNIFKSKNKNLQPPKTKTKVHKHMPMKVINALGQIC